MAEEIEKAQLRGQRDAALDAADEAQTVRDVAIGAVVSTARERDLAQTERDRLAVEQAATRGQRDAAWQYAAVEQQEARGSAVGFYMLLAIVVLVLLVIAGVYLTRTPNPQPSTTVEKIPQPMAPAATSAPQVLPPSSVPASPPPAPVTPAPSQTTPVPSSTPAVPIYPVPSAPAPLPSVPSAGSAPSASSDTGVSSPPGSAPTDGGVAPGGGSSAPAAPDGGTISNSAPSTPGGQ